jgi:hypothetical protein
MVIEGQFSAYRLVVPVAFLPELLAEQTTAILFEVKLALVSCLVLHAREEDLFGLTAQCRGQSAYKSRG